MTKFSNKSWIECYGMTKEYRDNYDATFNRSYDHNLEPPEDEPNRCHMCGGDIINHLEEDYCDTCIGVVEDILEEYCVNCKTCRMSTVGECNFIKVVDRVMEGYVERTKTPGPIDRDCPMTDDNCAGCGRCYAEREAEQPNDKGLKIDENITIDENVYYKNVYENVYKNIDNLEPPEDEPNKCLVCGKTINDDNHESICSDCCDVSDGNIVNGVTWNNCINCNVCSLEIENECNCFKIAKKFFIDKHNAEHEQPNDKCGNCEGTCTKCKCQDE